MGIIDIHNLQVHYGHVRALESVTVSVEPGEFLGIIGPNGGGKTTTVKAVLGLIKPKSGTIKIDDKAVIGYVPQLTTFDRDFPILVREVILTGHLPRKIRIGHRCSNHEKSHAMKVMKRLDIEMLADRQIGQLSGGQMQKVLIARALMNHPNVLILDEPTAGVDEASKIDIYDMLKDLNETITIIMISHDTVQLMPYLDRVVYINKRAHIHDNPYQSIQRMSGSIDPKTCPIDWFIRGEQVQKNLVMPTKTEGGGIDD